VKNHEPGTTDCFRAGVYEHIYQGDDTLEDPHVIIGNNLKVFEEIASTASQYGTNILVYPENGIINTMNYKRHTVATFAEHIPDPSTGRFAPCNTPQEYTSTPITLTLSCLAKTNHLYIVADYGDRIDCKGTGDANCPHDGHYLYNTAVVFGDDGSLVAKYHKQHLFFESQYNTPKEVEVIHVDTPYGRMGLQICFDILFRDPGVDAVAKYDIQTMLFPTYWFDELPLRSAKQVQEGWALNHRVNLLTANILDLKTGSVGTGIYAGENGPIVSTDITTKTAKLLIADIPIDSRNPMASCLTTNPFNKTVAIDALKTTSEYRYKQMDINGVTLYKLVDKQQDHVVCDKGLCCHLNYSVVSELSLSRESYWLMVRNSSGHTYPTDPTIYPMCEEICAVFRCEGQSTGRCVSFPTEANETVFQWLGLSARFATNYTYASVTANHLALVPKQYWVYEYEAQLEGRDVRLKVEDYDKPLMAMVGGGSAGCVIANRLSAQQNTTVLLIEAGDYDTNVTDLSGFTHYLHGFLKHEAIKRIYWEYYNVRQKYAGLAFPFGIIDYRGKGLGGSSSLNYMFYIRGNRKDFDNWAHNYGAKGWSYDEILEFFMKSENNSDQNIVKENPGFHGTTGPLSVSTPTDPPVIYKALEKVLTGLGHKTVDMNGANQLGTGLSQMTIRGGQRMSTAKAYLKPNPYPSRLTIMTNAFVTKILVNKTSDNKLRAFGVQYSVDNEKRIVLATNEVILSAGPMNSPQILMLSGIGPKDHLKQHNIDVKVDLPVGNHLVNHPLAITLSVIRDPQSQAPPLPQLNANQLNEFLLKFRNLCPFSGQMVFTNSKRNADKKWPDIQFLAIVNKLSHVTLLSLGTSLLRARSRGTVRLASANPFDAPLIDNQFLAHPLDREDMMEALKYSYYLLQNTSMSQYVNVVPLHILGCPKCTDRPLYECDPYIDCVMRMTTMSYFHPMGTCRMGAEGRADVVVNERLLVKGVSGLRVCDSSVFSDNVNANTNAATIMVAEKCAHTVVADRKAGHT
ncbi:unnamed protein product, partial [Oppiella nova]